MGVLKSINRFICIRLTWFIGMVVFIPLSLINPNMLREMMIGFIQASYKDERKES